MLRFTIRCGSENAWRIIPAEFVTTASGTGLVHVAPAFGEDDYGVLEFWREELVENHGIESSELPKLINCVGPDGKFTKKLPSSYAGGG